MTDVGELVVRIRADAAQLEREMQKANGIVKKSAGDMSDAFGGLKSQILALAPAISAVAFVEFGKRAIDAAGHIVDLADRIGFASDSLAALESPLEESGSNLDEFSAAINRMNNLVGEAAKGNEEAIRSFDQLGLSVSKLQKLSPEDQFYAIAGALGQIKDQSKQTEAGMNIFGRTFAVLLPLIKQYDGDLRKATEAKDGLVPSKEDLDRIDAFGDALTNAGIKAKNAFIEAFAEVLRLYDRIEKFNDEFNNGTDNTSSPIDQSGGFGGSTRFKIGTETGPARTPGPHTSGPLEETGGLTDARGSNKDVLVDKDAAKRIADAREALDDYNRSLREEQALLGLSERDRAAQEARFRTEEIARKGGTKATNEQTEANAALALSNYDLKKSQDEVNKSLQEAARFQQELHDKLSATLTDIAFRADSAADAILGFAESIAKAAFEKRVAGPIADALIGSGGNKGIFDDAIGGVGKFFGGFFADGGSPPVGIPSIVGERGPEIFVPNSAGTIVPNNKIGGTTVVVQQTIQLSPGMPELINARIREAAPVIAAQAQAAVFSAMQQGGSASKIVGARS